MPDVTKRILVVDDERDARVFVRAVAEDLGHAVLEAADGDAGLAAARREKPDLIILDVQMPKRDGFAVFADLRADPATRDIPVIMLTAVTARTGIEFSAKHLGEFYGAEPQAYIDKPIEPAALSRAVQRLLGG
jgi:CheY-like chemotaxis protein